MIDNTIIRVARSVDAVKLTMPNWSNKTSSEMPFTQYDIKETDFRVKTAKIVTPMKIDLTTGQYSVLISSKYHENFSGIILESEYDEDKGLYTYQCQDWSRKYMGKFELFGNNIQRYRLLRYLLTRGGLSAFKSPSKKDLESRKEVISGLWDIDKYNQKLYDGNIYGVNAFKDSLNLIIRDKSYMEVIRGTVYDALGYYDIWFNDKGILQITPMSKTDWENTGLVLASDGFTDRKMKFSTTNVITNVIIDGKDFESGEMIKSSDTLNLNLTAFFGYNVTSISNQNKDTSNATSNKNSSSSSTSNKNGNPYNNKSKKVWINADNGSNGMKNNLIKALKNDGWTVHDGGTGSNNHYSGYFNVDKSYSVYITLYNGFCAGTIREAYSSKIQNELKKKGVQLVPIWDSSGWTNPNGMKPYRYGDFSKYRASRAWDDNFSSGDPSISNVGDFMKKNKATYCVGPSTSDIMKQFRAGGYFKYKGISV